MEQTNQIMLCKNSACKKKKCTLNLSSDILPYGIFSECDIITEITIPDSVSIIDMNAFYKCYSLKKITLSKNITEIKYKAFSFCYKLKEVTLPESIKILRKEAFSNCIGLRKINIPESIEIVEDDVFKNCSSLSEINNIEKLLSINPKVVKSLSQFKDAIIIPENLMHLPFSKIESNEVKTGKDLVLLLNELYSIYKDSQIFSYLYDYIVLENSIEKISKKYNLKDERIVKNRLEYIAKFINIEYFDYKLFPVYFKKIVPNKYELKRIYNLDKYALRYLTFKSNFLKKPYIPDTISQEILDILQFDIEKQKQLAAEEKRLKIEKENKLKIQLKEKKEELSKNLEVNFMKELSSLLIINKTNTLTIDGTYYTYTIEKINKSISISKKNIQTEIKLLYNLDFCTIQFLNNTDYKDSLYFIYEFYMLFVHRWCSSVLTQIYNTMTKQDDKEQLIYNIKGQFKNEKYAYCKVIKPGVHILVILFFDEYGEILDKTAFRKIDGIPIWFIISKDGSFIVSEKPKRLITFFSQKKQTPIVKSTFRKSFEYLVNANIEKNTEELVNFESIYMDLTYGSDEELNIYYLYHCLSSEQLPNMINCPKCGKVMNPKYEHYNYHYICPDYPKCSGEIYPKNNQ